MQAALTDVVNDGLDRASLLAPGHGTIDLFGGITQDMAFARGEAAMKISTAAEAFAFAQVQKDFHRPDVEVEAGAGLRVRF